MDFFRDHNGKHSMMRLISFICVVGALPLCYIHPEQSLQWVGIITAGTVFKWAQSKGESK